LHVQEGWEPFLMILASAFEIGEYKRIFAKLLLHYQLNGTTDDVESKLFY
jgi:hypothetical protein